jgi:hypothetical protein
MALTGATGLAKCAKIATPEPMRGLLRTSLRFLTWCCVAVLAFLSLLPAPDMVRTGFPGRLEHFVAYAGSAAIATAGYGLNRSATRVIGCFWLYAGILEYLQHFSPGRHLSTYGTTGLGRRIWRNRGSTSRSAGSKEGTAPIRHPQPIMPGSPPPTRLKETPNGRPSNSPKSEG